MRVASSYMIRLNNAIHANSHKDSDFSSPGDFFMSVVLPGIVVIGFWMWKSATPGKMAIGAKIVDATTGAAPTTPQLLLRYLGYFVSVFPACLGLVWVGFDRRKQGWHDKIAGTVVVRPHRVGQEPVRFTGPG